MKRLFTAALVLLAVTTSTKALAAAVDDRVANLERQMSTLQNTRNTNNQEVASALSRFEGMETEFNAIKGQVEATSHIIQSGNAELQKQVTELENRIQAIEDRMAIFSSQLTKALGKVAPAAAAEGDLYQKALDLATASKYLEAAAAFESFLKQYPQSSFAGSARYWIAECFYSTRDYQRSIKEFQAYVDKYPKGEKVAEAIFKQGNAFFELGMMDEAKAFYDKVISSYGRSSYAAQAQERLARIQKRQAGATAPQGNLGSYPAETLEQRMQRSQPQAPQQQQTAPKGTPSAPRAPRDF